MGTILFWIQSKKENLGIVGPTHKYHIQHDIMDNDEVPSILFYDDPILILGKDNTWDIMSKFYTNQVDNV